LFVNTTSTNDGTQSFLKQVGFLSKIIYRSYRTFDIDKFNNDIDQIKMENLDSVTSAEQVNETYQKYENEFINVQASALEVEKKNYAFPII
jgi:hypothetical protein